MKLISVQVEKISFHPSSHSYAVILKELEGERKLPVIVGAFEAQSIALALEKVQPPRPMTHDLIRNVVQSIDADLTAVTVTELKDGVYYARLELDSILFGSRSIDSRPSDAIAVALRLNAPIMVAEQVMRESSVLDKEAPAIIQPETKNPGKPTRMRLEKELGRAVEREEYEIAARLRDKIKELYS